MSILYSILFTMLAFTVVFASTQTAFAQPVISLDKTADQSLVLPGTPVTFTYTISVPLGGEIVICPPNTISDNIHGTISSPRTVLRPGQSVSFMATFPISSTETNTATATCVNDEGTPASDSDSETVEVFMPSVLVTKDGDSLSKEGDDVTYDFTVTNTGTSNSPSLILDSIVDTLLGDLALAAPPACDSLAPGASCSFSVTRTVMVGDPDPLDNTVTVHYHSLGFTNDVTDSDSHSVNLFDASVLVTKDGPSLSKEGDDVTYDFTVTNTGSADSPSLILDSIVDTLLGDLALAAPPACDSLAPGASCSFSVTRTVMVGDPDPLDNTVTVHYHPDGFSNDITDSDSHSVNLFDASVLVTKDGPTTADVGDDVTYLYTITNTGSADSPSLEYVSAIDDLIGPLDAAALPDCALLAPGASCSFSVTRTVLITDPNPLVNTVTVRFNPEGFSNDITDSDSHSITINLPASVKLLKMANPILIESGENVEFKIDVTANSLADLFGCVIIDDNGTPFDPSDDVTFGPFDLPSGGSTTFMYNVDVPSDRKNTARIMCADRDGNPVVDMAMAQVTVLVVGGRYLPVDSVSLLLAGIPTSAVWLAPAIVGFAGLGLYLVKFREKKD